MNMFNAVVFVVSYPGAFKRKTGTVIRAAYEERFVVSAKQSARLDQWVKSDRESDEDDVTTEAYDSPEMYDSDHWD